MAVSGWRLEDTGLKGKPGYLLGIMGRTVIAMTAVRIGTLVQAGKVTDQPDIRPPTDVMAITSLPYASPIIRSPVSF